MSSPSLLTPSSGQSVYFDAPINQSDMTVSENKSQTNGAADVPPNSAVAFTNGPPEESGDAIVEKDAPAYTPPGPDEKLSRSYITADTKPPIPPRSTASPKHIAEPATTTTQPQSSSIARRDHAASPTSRSTGGSPASVSAASGHIKEEGSTFANGAAITGPNAEPDVQESVHTRAATAETTLSAKTKSKLSKAELKDGKRLSKIIKAESKAEKQALELSIKELSQLQSQQISAVRREGKVYTAYTKALKLHHQTESKYLKFKAEYDQNQLNAQNLEAALENERANSREIMERTGEKAREVEKLRIMYSTDEREREAKLLELNQGRPHGLFSLSTVA